MSPSTLPKFNLACGSEFLLAYASHIFRVIILFEIANLESLFIFLNRTLLSTREPTHKEVIFCKMNLKLEKLC